MGLLGELDSLEAGDITFWYANEQGSSRPVLIDWYKKDPSAADFNFDEDVVREYVYVQGSDFVFEDVRNSVATENDLPETGVTAPTPLDDVSWKLTTNHYPQVKKNENVSAYYFQLEGDENTPEGDKVIYLPYSYIDEDLTFKEAENMKLKVKIHHYKEDHSELVEGKPLDGELTEYGIRFVVKSFSPFVIEWEEQEEEKEEDIFDWEDIFGNLGNGSGGVANGNKVTVIDGREDEKNHETGAPGFEISSAIAVLSTAATIFIKKKK